VVKYCLGKTTTETQKHEGWTEKKSIKKPSKARLTCYGFGTDSIGLDTVT
jgi:hypothetical protein